MLTICSCFLNEGVISKARPVIALINQGFLAFEGWITKQCDSKVSPRTNLKDKKADILYRYVPASITLTEAMRAAVDIYCISSKAVA